MQSIKLLDPPELLRCAPISRPTETQRQAKDVIRFVMVSVAVVAAILLIAGALDYTNASSKTVKHGRLLAPRVPLVRLS